MAIVRYIAERLTEEEPIGVYTNHTGNGYAYTRFKLTETEYNAETGVSKLKIELQVKGNVTWVAGGANFGNIKVKINGTEIGTNEWTQRSHSSSGEFTTVLDTEQTLEPRESGNNAAAIEVGYGGSQSDGYAYWVKNYAYCAAKTGTYAMPLSGTGGGSAVYIGGERYNVYIGNGSTWERYNAYIGANGAWERY